MKRLQIAEQGTGGSGDMAGACHALEWQLVARQI